MSRAETIQTIRNNPMIDVLIIGGGVNGIGTFRDLALQGLKVVLVESNDYCSGASAGSSHMLHGGIRYLENGEFRLVREALHERNLLLKNAPHYAKPLPTTIPIFKWFSGFLNAPLKFLGLSQKPSERGGVIIKLGLVMYDLFTGAQQTMPFHKFHAREMSLKKYPKLNKDIVCTATYYDAYMPYPERLCLDLIRDAQQTSPYAHALNYARVTCGAGNSVEITDTITNTSFSVTPKVVINAAGPWIDFVNKALGEKTQFIGGTKGSHLILDNPALYDATSGSEIFFESEDGRIVLIFPYMGKVMIGTTDIRIDNPDQVVCTPDEEEYIMSLVRRVFPTIPVEPSQIIYRFTGVRPLPASANKRTGVISRDHSIVSIPANDQLSFPIHSLVGGKWTTFRAFSEQAANMALSDLGKTRRVDTAGIPIGGGKGFPVTDSARQQWLSELQSQTELEVTHLSMLLDRYGTYAEQVARFMSKDNDAPLKTLPHYTQREITFLAQEEAVYHIDDFMMRRSLAAMLGYNSGAVVVEVGEIIGAALQWSPEKILTEIQRMNDLLAHKHGMVNNR